MSPENGRIECPRFRDCLPSWRILSVLSNGDYPVLLALLTESGNFSLKRVCLVLPRADGVLDCLLASFFPLSTSVYLVVGKGGGFYCIYGFVAKFFGRRISRSSLLTMGINSKEY